MQYFFSQINCSEGVLPNDEFRKKIHCIVFKISVKMRILMVKPLQNVIFLEGLLPKYFFQEICSSGGKYTIRKVSAAFILKNCHPRNSLILFHTGLFGTFSPEGHPP